MAESKNVDISITPVVVVQNVGNAGLVAIKSLLSKGGYKVRTASRNPDKLKSTKLAGLDVEVFKTGDDALFEGATNFICIAPGTKEADDRQKVAIEFLKKCKEAGATSGSILSVVVAPAEDRRGLFGAQFGAVEDFAGSMEGMKVCTIRAPFFLDNMWGDVDTIKSHDTFYAPVASDVRQLAAAVADVGEALAVGAVNEKFAGKGFFVLGDHITKGEVAALYSKIKIRIASNGKIYKT